MDEERNGASDLSILVLGTADWNQAIATNQHYMVRELSKLDQADLAFVESLGLRSPELTLRDIRRIWRRLRSSFRKGRPEGRRPLPSGVRLISPMVVPWHWPLFEALNTRLLRRSVQDWAASPGKRILWTYTPVTYGLDSVADAVVYHCVDLLGSLPGIDPNVVTRAESRLASRATRAIASSSVVADHLRESGFRDPLLWENVADTDVFLAAPTSTSENAAIFAGNITPKKIDFALLRALADAGIDVALAGPRAEGGGSDEAEYQSLVKAGVRYLGLLTLDELAEALVQFKVGLVPYVQNEYTRGVSPLKTFEYLAAGLPVVATAIPGVAARPGLVYVENDSHSFVDRVQSLVHCDSIDVEGARAFAAEHSWSQRGGAARALIQQLFKE